ncbi:MFS transporter [Anaeromyxobacter diazotrophicus]|uniref:MFS transporter n=1 Tax=Anaeromyxobacter diazotrophicus TaxID=2590199 RepID=A0A7I9VKC6_9BACT|nr:MFS transporter [Anaeromyxobacter diazotrophicus]GEJ56841.1 MFS transporter [Anaeromyxobacter diazotrophicus]
MATTLAPPKPPPPAGSIGGITKEEQLVIFASSLGTVFEWYDFYLYGSLAAIIGKQFFSALNETSAFIFALLAFAAGFAVRPFGAIVFGRLGDMIGRKYTFLVTILIMGLSTFIVGLLPSYATIGVAAPIILIGLRLLQGLALGGEYGGAATYVAEHAPPGKRGFFTSFIQTTATIGLFLSLLVILGCRNLLGPAFDTWGWRIPFVLSALLLAISVYIRLKLSESPVFKRMKEEGKASKAPLTESFLRWGNLKVVLLILFGGTAGQGVVWYTGMFYELFFLQQTLKVDPSTANILVAIALVLATPFFIVFGALSDKIGRKRIIMAGCVIAALTYFPVFKALTRAANPDIAAAEAAHPVTVVADPKDCSVQFDPIGKTQFTTSCDLVKSFLAKRAIPYTNEEAPAGTIASAKIGGGATISSFPGRQLAPAEFKTQNAAFQKQMTDAVNAAGYPTKADPNKINRPMVIFLLWLLAIYVTLVYAPIAAWLVELFPARIRYTSMSLPYHIGNGWFGGFLPTIAFAMVAATGDIYYGLWYPIVIAVMTAVIGTLFLPETKDREIHHA